MTDEEMIATITTVLEAKRYGLDDRMIEGLTCALIGEWVLKGYSPPLNSILNLLRSHSIAFDHPFANETLADKLCA